MQPSVTEVPCIMHVNDWRARNVLLSVLKTRRSTKGFPFVRQPSKPLKNTAVEDFLILDSLANKTS